MNYLLLSRVKSPRMRFGQWVRARRREMGLTQQALAAKAGNQQSRISDIERGLESLTREEVSAIGAALGDSERAIEIWIRPPNAPPVAPSISDEETRLLAAYRAVASGEVRAFLLRMVESAGQTDEPAAA